MSPLVVGRPRPPSPLLYSDIYDILPTWTGDIHLALMYTVYHRVPLEEAHSHFMRVYYPFIDWEAGDLDSLIATLMDELEWLDYLQEPLAD